jgi:hypothetical protein
MPVTAPDHDQFVEQRTIRHCDGSTSPGADQEVPLTADAAAEPMLPGRAGLSAPVASAAMVQRLQSAAGNRATAGMLAQRAAETADAPARRPEAAADPKFTALRADVHRKQQTMATHPPATSEAAAAGRAAVPPQDDKQAQGKAANAEKMNAARPGEFDKAAFIRAVDEALAAQAPKNLDEADKFGESGKAGAVKDKVQGQVGDGKKKSAAAIETAMKAPPDPSAAKDKPVTPLSPDQPPAVPGTPDPSKAVPDQAPAAATDFSARPERVDQQLAEAQVTEEQLARSNEPEFTGALQEKKAGEQHTATAPGQIRAGEAQTLAGAKAAAGQAGAAAMTALAGDRKAAGARVGAGKQDAKGEDEAKRAQVTARLQAVFDATKKDAEGILSDLDKKVDDAFARGEKAARDAFTADHKRRMAAYKDKRYSGFTGKLRWAKDKFTGLPEEANQIFVTARQGYVTRMRQVISSVADLIGADLTRAKQRIAQGRNQLQAEVKKLPADLRAIGKQAAGEFAAKFDELTESVDAKGKALVQTLASKYSEALKTVDEEIAKEKEKNKGLVAKALDAVGGVIKTIMQLKDLLLGVLAKAASAVMAILKDPIGFLGNLVSAVGAGLKAFLANIGTHLKKGLIGWLLGAMAGAGLQLPAKFDLKGILTMIASLLGLTWAAIRGRIVSKGVPEQAMGAVEQSVPVVAKLRSEGVAGVTEEIKEQVGDLKENLFSKISEYLIPTVLIAGITWIVSLLNPASAFVKACKMIVDFVSFIIDQGAQIIAFVNSVLDAIIAIAGGGGGGVPALIEKALAASIPVLIGALAAILGIGGVANKVKSFFHALSKPVMKAVDWIVNKIVTLGKKIWAKLKSKLGKQDKVEQTPEQDVQARWKAGLAAIRRIAGRSRSGGMETKELHTALVAVKEKHQFQELYAHRRGSGWAVYAKLNPDNRDNLIPISGRTLLIGEGNLSFTGSVVVLGINLPGNITATVYEKKEEKSAEAQRRAGQLAEQGVTVEFGVDATALHEGSDNLPKYDTIVWMFPHPGGDRASMATRGAALLSAFFASAAQRLAPGGKIVVTLRVGKQPNYYVTRWRPVEAAAAAGLTLVSRNDFAQSDYPGYSHETTEGGAHAADVSQGFTFIFTKG